VNIDIYLNQRRGPYKHKRKTLHITHTHFASCNVILGNSVHQAELLRLNLM